ncbi:DNA cytosine methyltransferase [Fibrella aquatica]|uniref:DNA cytosine methyltransferase n=1 Tax=Fibrella aquatica TaxID=3242487 RepID=UPI00351F886F
MKLRFVDLFAGLGGFHIGISQLGHECVFASELNPTLATLYEKNFSFDRVEGDIRKVDEMNIPAHDLLCAGFPCQPFSKAGGQLGLLDVDRGNLFYDIIRIIKQHNPKYIILENVANLLTHDNGNTWRIIKASLMALDYEVDHKILSPHQFGIPQIRQRMFIVASREGLNHFVWPEKGIYPNMSIRDALEDYPFNARCIPLREKSVLDIWQRFLNAIPEQDNLPSFPIWATEFGATYPYENQVPEKLTRAQLSQYKGAFGESLDGLSKLSQLKEIPTYAHGKELFPRWKQLFIKQNREFFQRYQNELWPVMEELKNQPFSWQKFEWNCKGERRRITDFIIQFRPSGIRVKRPVFSPALVAFTKTQIPIIGWEYRYMTKREGANLQSLGDIELPELETPAFKALGNAVNARIVQLIAERLIGTAPQATVLNHNQEAMEVLA